MPIGILGPGVEMPVGEGYSRFRVSDEDGTRVSCPHAIRGQVMKTDAREIGPGAFENACRKLLCFGAFHENMDLLSCGEKPDDFGIDPWNGLKLSRPILMVMGPCQPGGLVRLPLGGHAIAELTRCFFRLFDFHFCPSAVGSGL